ncbi:hypothetical protein AaE_008848 [Aphanomyces astaci]|uniref:DUF4485 domain-containing protein n=1 Tax=Aphanomyces astaci TaxID=112090 RepID=A0A6A5ADZ0_APHAT|nr:hypothetical protein AaE_008848 [Aphanomyces astaci]
MCMGGRIRIEKWVDKISQPIVHLQWKKNANYYAILLLDMVRRGVFRAPFDKTPPFGPLQTLPRHMVTTYLHICALDGMQKQPRQPPPPHPQNAWLKAYERVVRRTRTTTTTEATESKAKMTSLALLLPPSQPPERDPRRPSLSYVEIANERLTCLEADFAAEQATNRSLDQQLEELTTLCKTQSATIEALKAELLAVRASHTRELDRLNMLHAVEVDELKKKHHRHMQDAIISNQHTIATRQALAKVSAGCMLVHGMRSMYVCMQTETFMGGIDDHDGVQDFLAYIDRFHVETTALTKSAAATH